MDSSLPARFPLIGTPVSAITFEGLVQALVAAPGMGRRLAVHFCTVHSLVAAAERADLRDAFRDADVVAPDGMPLVWAGRLRGRRVERVCGPDFMPALIDAGRAVGARHYFLGGRPGTPERLAQRFATRFPGTIVAGTFSPPFRALTAEEDAALVERINAARPDFVWVGLGSPKQEHLIRALRPLLPRCWMIGVGISFSFIAGDVRRAPPWMQKTGLEWVHRLAQEPKRLAHRYLVDDIPFAFSLFWHALRRRVARRTMGTR